jgi:hypothetical protein
MPEEAKRMVGLETAAKRVMRERAKENWVQASRKEKTNRPTKWMVKALARRSYGTGRGCGKQPPVNQNHH